MHMRCVCAHVYAQTVHTLASHEMFISYVDVQTCMARKTSSFHVHRMGVAQWVQGAWALPLSLRDLEQAPPPLASVPPLYRDRGLGTAHPDSSALPCTWPPGKFMDTAQDRGRCCGHGPALPERGTGLLLAQPPGPGPSGPAGLPITLSLKAFGRGS